MHLEITIMIVVMIMIMSAIIIMIMIAFMIMIMIAIMITMCFLSLEIMRRKMAFSLFQLSV